MTTINRLAQYKNGNCLVTLLEDGSKTRSWEGEAKPLFPESIDLKITDYCDAGCAFCHEKSTIQGRHASFDSIMQIVEGLPRGVEIAIGGGNPLDHPELADVLGELHGRGLVANMTVNAIHLADPLLINIRGSGLIKGLGISYNPSEAALIKQKIDNNTVVHVIAGVDDFFRVKRERFPKLLVLGYKEFGRGIRYKETRVHSHKISLDRWKYWATRLLEDSLVAFDNLALEQLNIKAHLTKEYWDEHYMGDDGRFTMYCDAVTNEYAVSSTSPRRGFGPTEKSAADVFHSLLV